MISFLLFSSSKPPETGKESYFGLHYMGAGAPVCSFLFFLASSNK